MRFLILVLLLLVGCGDARPDKERTNGYVVPANGDPTNFTWNGYPRHRFAACGRYIKLSKPFEVVPGGFNDPLAVPLSYLEDPKTHERAPEGVDESRRISFDFPARYRGNGMWEWQTPMNTQGKVKPIASASALLKAAKERGGSYADEETYFQGVVNRRPAAMTCTMVTVPNSWCDIEVKINGDQRFSARLPPHAVTKLERVVAIGTSLFANLAKECGPHPQLRSAEIRIFPSRNEAEKFLSKQPVLAR
ncbi:hypothetical protein [Sphingomonas aerolata]|uniref:hypothetical protein n=1 Tax=Sphingomonas aerolata TaxID=185951 RepID=UPI00208E3315|nr:hypothetical protein [Sphingomonas aerolata]USR02381.1 hypothetical protein NEF64_18915 [Sphingomonas aerolata]